MRTVSRVPGTASSHSLAVPATTAHLLGRHDDASSRADGHADDALREALANARDRVPAHADHHGAQQTRARVPVRL